MELVCDERIWVLNDAPVQAGDYVLYRMQSSLRINDNLTLLLAIKKANELKLPLLVIFRLDDNYPEANYRHFVFLIQGLDEIETKLNDLGIRFLLVEGDFESSMQPLLQHAACVFTDVGYMRIHRQWIKLLAQISPSTCISVEDNLMIPIEAASNKCEWAARTIRPKLVSKLVYFMRDAGLQRPKLSVKKTNTTQEHQANTALKHALLERVKRNKYLPSVLMRGGETVALQLLNKFLQNDLPNYDQKRNDPSLVGTSHLSPYLHFGFLSPLTIFTLLRHLNNDEAFAEQLLVRRELAFNFVYYTHNYDTFDGLPEWAKNTLFKHKDDLRSTLYMLNELEDAHTHDPYWNSAMREMISTGYMENTMRMYWAKKLIEWCATPQLAYEFAIYLNNKYLLDGRDPNSYVGVGWCFGLHDRPWKERDIYGMIRYMTPEGLKRKYNMHLYVHRWCK